jgi:hypothetical protein
MKALATSTLLAVALAAAFTATDAHSPAKTAGYNHPIPEKIMAPDKVETRIGTSNFVDGKPDAALKVLKERLGIGSVNLRL